MKFWVITIIIIVSTFRMFMNAEVTVIRVKRGLVTMVATYRQSWKLLNTDCQLKAHLTTKERNREPFLRHHLVNIWQKMLHECNEIL